MDDSGSNSPPPTMVPSVYRDHHQQQHHNQQQQQQQLQHQSLHHHHTARRSVSPEGGSSSTTKGGRSTPSSPMSSSGCLPSATRYPGVPAFMLNGSHQLATRYSMLAAAQHHQQQQRFQLDQQQQQQQTLPSSGSASSRGGGGGGSGGAGGGGGAESPPGLPTADAVAASDCRLIDYRGAKVAAFSVAGEYLLCLPQAFDMFLKHLVGGLHTVYTKLKRLDITPIVCNVEQVRVLRGLGAIQPGVNRCKLLSCKDFDALYKDCTTARKESDRGLGRSHQDAPVDFCVRDDRIARNRSASRMWNAGLLGAVPSAPASGHGPALPAHSLPAASPAINTNHNSSSSNNNNNNNSGGRSGGRSSSSNNNNNVSSNSNNNNGISNSLSSLSNGLAAAHALSLQHSLLQNSGTGASHRLTAATFASLKRSSSPLMMPNGLALKKAREEQHLFELNGHGGGGDPSKIALMSPQQQQAIAAAQHLQLLSQLHPQLQSQLQGQLGQLASPGLHHHHQQQQQQQQQAALLSAVALAANRGQLTQQQQQRLGGTATVSNVAALRAASEPQHQQEQGQHQSEYPLSGCVSLKDKLSLKGRLSGSGGGGGDDVTSKESRSPSRSGSEPPALNLTSSAQGKRASSLRTSSDQRDGASGASSQSGHDDCSDGGISASLVAQLKLKLEQQQRHQDAVLQLHDLHQEEHGSQTPEQQQQRHPHHPHDHDQFTANHPPMVDLLVDPPEDGPNDGDDEMSLVAAAAAAAVASAAPGSVEGLLRNIQTLLQLAAETAREFERRSLIEKTQLKLEIQKERDSRANLEKQLEEATRLREIYQRRLKKERRHRREMEETLEKKSDDNPTSQPVAASEDQGDPSSVVNGNIVAKLDEDEGEAAHDTTVLSKGDSPVATGLTVQ